MPRYIPMLILDPAFKDMDDYEPITNDIIKTMSQKQDEVIESIVRHFAEPPIKGVITKGKLKWRGITLNYQKESMLKSIAWIEQRGKKIGPDIIIDYTIV